MWYKHVYLDLRHFTTEKQNERKEEDSKYGEDRLVNSRQLASLEEKPFYSFLHIKRCLNDKIIM